MMNRWAHMLAEVPPSLQRLIARSQRISLPRSCAAEQRIQRLREALCHAATVRATYQWLPSEVQAALQHLRTLRGGISPAELEQTYGPVRSWTQLLADPQPHTISERLILLGWLLPRPAAPFNPPRFLLPPELRQWLPQPLHLHSLGEVPPSEAEHALLVPPAVRVAATLLLACAERPLPVRSDGSLKRAALHRLAPALVPLTPDEAAAVCAFTWPLACAFGLVAVHGGRAMPAPAGERFLREPLAERRTQLLHAWLNAPQPDKLFTPLLIDTVGIDWMHLRRRLLAWAELLPPLHAFDPSQLFASLTAACGPLADTHTHGFRHVDRVPWQEQRAAAIWEAALHGPLTWLGEVAWTTTTTGKVQPLVYRPHPSSIHEQADTTHVGMPDAASSWRYGEAGQVIVPHTSVDAAVLRLLPFVANQTTDAHATTYRITQRSLTRAAAQGWSSAVLWDLLQAHLGAPPTRWRDHLVAPAVSMQIATRIVVTSDTPAILDRAARGASVRRHLTTRLAPGIALVDEEHVAPLVRALERQGVGVAVDVPAAPPAASALHAGEYAALLVACAFYRDHAPPDAPLLPHSELQQRLRAALPPALRASTDAVLADLQLQPLPTREAGVWQAPHQPLPPTPLLVVHADANAVAVSPPVPLAACAESLGVERCTDSVQADERTHLHLLRREIAHQQTVEVSYRTEQGEQSRRVLRPLELERRSGVWYLRAYCHLRRAERTFRVDRIGGIGEPNGEDGVLEGQMRQQVAA